MIEISYTEMKLLDKLPNLLRALEVELHTLSIETLTPDQARKVEKYIEYGIVYGFEQGLNVNLKIKL